MRRASADFRIGYFTCFLSRNLVFVTTAPLPIPSGGAHFVRADCVASKREEQNHRGASTVYNGRQNRGKAHFPLNRFACSTLSLLNEFRGTR